MELVGLEPTTSSLRTMSSATSPINIVNHLARQLHHKCNSQLERNWNVRSVRFASSSTLELALGKRFGPITCQLKYQSSCTRFNEAALNSARKANQTELQGNRRCQPCRNDICSRGIRLSPLGWRPAQFR